MRGRGFCCCCCCCCCCGGGGGDGGKRVTVLAAGGVLRGRGHGWYVLEAPGPWASVVWLLVRGVRVGLWYVLTARAVSIVTASASASIRRPVESVATVWGRPQPAPRVVPVVLVHFIESVLRGYAGRLQGDCSCVSRVGAAGWVGAGNHGQLCSEVWGVRSGKWAVCLV